jgi:hypothetical protein
LIWSRKNRQQQLAWKYSMMINAYWLMQYLKQWMKFFKVIHQNVVLISLMALVVVVKQWFTTPLYHPFAYATSPTPDSIILPSQCHIVTTNIIDAVFPDLSDPNNLASTVILCPTNDHTLKLNDAILKKMPGQETNYFSPDEGLCDDQMEAANHLWNFFIASLLLECHLIV